MTPGDVPCERPCATRWCIYNQFGVCTDNARCGDWTGDAEVKNFTAPRRGVPEAQKPPRQETGPSPAILEGTR